MAEGANPALIAEATAPLERVKRLSSVERAELLLDVAEGVYDCTLGLRRRAVSLGVSTERESSGPTEDSREAPEPEAAAEVAGTAEASKEEDCRGGVGSSGVGRAARTAGVCRRWDQRC